MLKFTKLIIFFYKTNNVSFILWELFYWLDSRILYAQQCYDYCPQGITGGIGTEC